MVKVSRKKPGGFVKRKKSGKGLPKKKRVVLVKGHRCLYDVDTNGKPHLYLLDKKK